MPKPLTKESSILVVGGGTWGASTALHLARKGYGNVKVLDPYACPSPISAGNDVNKIVSTISWRPKNDPSDDLVPISTHISARASEGWLNDPVFKPYYHETGYIAAASTPEGLEFVREREIEHDISEYTYLEGEEFRQTMREGVLTGKFEGWKGYWNKKGAGWAFARGAMVSACREAERLGVKFVSGEARGAVTELLYDPETNDVIGAKTADGCDHLADRVILTAGPYADSLIDMKDQLRPTAWTLCHIKINTEELALYKNLPVMFNVERGFFMEPDEERGELKICDEHPGYTNFQSRKEGEKMDMLEHMRSTPFARHQVPKASEERVRAFLREAMPHLAARPLSFARICWCADTPDRNFLIDTHPSHPSLILGVGGSGHGYSHIPSVGGFIVEEMEGCLGKRFKEVFGWRPETAVNRDWTDLQGRWGVVRRVMDFGEVEEWTDVGDGRVYGEQEWVVL